jgi:hypothetical protein
MSQLPPELHRKCAPRFAIWWIVTRGGMSYLGGRVMMLAMFSKETTVAHEHFKACVDACNDCALACDHCASECLKEKGVATMARCIQLDIDCAGICRLAVGYMARGSELAAEICEVCATVCDACAQECAKHQMPHCQECAKSCRRCAEECRRMASARTGSRQGARAGVPAH